ncbi:MAG: hypothetical protein HUJ25_04575 [Crocinitomicaceae bacterium]|nr:hypothetical protein [Crocinitomicaceae bacterium]
MRRDFALPEQDVDFLDANELKWETVKDRTGLWLIIYEYIIPSGYNHDIVDIALKIEGGYPVTQIDMVYFNPDLQKANGNNTPIKALARLNMDGKNWQRWSRHRTGENPWRPGLDDISTHLQMVKYWLEREL